MADQTGKMRWIRGQGWQDGSSPSQFRTPVAAPAQQIAPPGGMQMPQTGIPGSNYGDYTGSGYDALQASLGVSGSNPARPLVRRGQVGLGSRVLSQIAFGNALEGDRQAIGRRLLSLLQGGREESMIAAERQRNRAEAMQNARDLEIQGRAAGYGQGTTGGLAENALGLGDERTNAYRRQIYSPEYQTAMANGVLQLIKLLQGDDLDRLTAGSGATQSSNLMKEAPQGAGFMGALGDLAGMAIGGGWNPFAGGGGQSNLMNLSQAALGGF